MKKINKFKKTVQLFLISNIVAFCMAGCAEEKTDDLKPLSLDSTKESVTEESVEDIREDVDEPIDMEESSEAAVYVYVCGAVEKPGVYKLASGARIYEAIACAGGLREDADHNYINQAKLLEDGEQIYIPTQEEAEQNNLSVKDTDTQSGITPDGKVNINTATKEELMTLSGIGESRAESILAYRQKNGAFQKVEDLMNVEGIKEGIFQKIKDSITVNTGS